MANIVKANIANALNSLTGVLGTTDQIVDPNTGRAIKDVFAVKTINNASAFEVKASHGFVGGNTLDVEIDEVFSFKCNTVDFRTYDTLTFTAPSIKFEVDGIQLGLSKNKDSLAISCVSQYITAAEWKLEADSSVDISTQIFNVAASRDIIVSAPGWTAIDSNVSVRGANYTTQVNTWNTQVDGVATLHADNRIIIDSDLQTVIEGETVRIENDFNATLDVADDMIDIIAPHAIKGTRYGYLNLSEVTLRIGVVNTSSNVSSAIIDFVDNANDKTNPYAAIILPKPDVKLGFVDSSSKQDLTYTIEDLYNTLMLHNHNGANYIVSEHLLLNIHADERLSLDAGDILIDGDTAFLDNINVAGNVTIDGVLTVDNDISGNGDLDITGESHLPIVISDLIETDKLTTNTLSTSTTIEDTFFRRPTANTETILNNSTATITSIKGNTLVFNQLVKNGDFSDGTKNWRWNGNVTVSNKICTFTTDDSASWPTLFGSEGSVQTFFPGHVYYTTITITSYTGTTSPALGTGYNPRAIGVWQVIPLDGIVGTHSAVTTLLDPEGTDYVHYTHLRLQLGPNCSISFKNLMIIDLTLMFGAGNEPSTAEEFEKLFPLAYYDYNPGSMLNNTIEGVRSCGSNLLRTNPFDTTSSAVHGTKSINGDLITLTPTENDCWLGSAINTGTSINSSKYDLQPVIPNKRYSLNCSNTAFKKNFVSWIDSNFISLGYISANNGTVVTAPSNAAYAILRIGLGDDNVINRPETTAVSFSLYDSDSTNTYEPYIETTANINATKITSNNVIIFPDGLKKAGNAYDEIIGNKAIKRIGSVDLGTITWHKSTLPERDGQVHTYRWICTIADMNSPTYNSDVYENMLCVEYPNKVSANTSYIGTTPGSSISKQANSTLFILQNDSYDDYTAAQFKEAMSGVILYYELAAPIEYDIDQVTPFMYNGISGGMETVLPVNGSTPVTAPPTLTVKYDLNNDNILSKLNSVEDIVEVNTSIVDSLTATTILVSKYGSNLDDALLAAMEDVDSTKTTILDCRDFTGNITISKTITIDRPCTIQFGNCTVTSTAANFFEIKSHNVTILGLGRQTDRNTSVTNSTTFILTGSTAINNDSDKGYHIYSKGCKNLRFEYFTLKGTRTTLGRQCGNNSYPIDGCGGIHIDKENPLITEGGNACNNIVINQLLIDGTKAHGIYISTPILTKISNTRLSQVAGHGIFLNGGTSVTLDGVYVASSNLAGFCILGVTYCTFLNTVAEYCPIAYLIRSSFNVSLFSPGCEETMNQTQNIWKDSQPISGKYGFNVQVSGLKNGVAATDIIPDVTSDLYNQFAGTPFMIVGGRGISLYTPYATGICRANNYKSAASEISQNRTSVLRVLGNARNVFVNNIQGTQLKSSTTSIYSDIRLEAVGTDAPNGVEVVFNPEYSLITASWTDVITKVANAYAPVYVSDKASNVVVRNGSTFYTNVVSPIITSMQKTLSNVYYMPKEKGYMYVIGDTTDIPLITNDTNAYFLSKEVFVDFVNLVGGYFEQDIQPYMFVKTSFGYGKYVPIDAYIKNDYTYLWFEVPVVNEHDDLEKYKITMSVYSGSQNDAIVYATKIY